MIASFSYSHSLSAEILAMMTYQKRSPESLKTFKLTGTKESEEGIVVLDIDPLSPTFDKILMMIPLPQDFFAGQMFLSPSKEKVYVTSRGKSELYTFGLNQFPYRLKKIILPNCKLAEKIRFSPNNLDWYLTCRMSEKIIVGEVKTDKIKNIMEFAGSYPHDLVFLPRIKRLLLSSSTSGDLNDAHNFLISIDKISGNEIQRLPVGNKKGRSAPAPGPMLHVQGFTPPTVLILNTLGSQLKGLIWDNNISNFKITNIFDFKSIKAQMPLDFVLDYEQKKLYVTTIKPGQLHVFDFRNNQPKINTRETINLAGGSRQIIMSSDRKYIFIQNSYLNLPGMSDGSVMVVDKKSTKLLATSVALKNKGLNPNSLMLIPDG